MKLPPPIEKAAGKLAELPSIGPRQAIRLAFHLVGEGRQNIRDLALSIAELGKMKSCERCFFMHENSGPLCEICADPRRAQNTIMIVEKETDLISLESTGKFSGRYFIAGEMPNTGLIEEWQKLRLQSLKSFIQKPAPEGPGGAVEEIILAFNPTSAGDFQASFFAKELGPLAKKLSRLGRGLPTGGEIEFADGETLGSALEGRRQ